MREVTSLELTAGTAVVSTALSVFVAFMPSILDVLHDPGSTDMRRAVSFGQDTGTVSTLTVGILLTALTRSPLPLVFAVGVSALMWLAYEYAYRTYTKETAR